MRYKVTKSGFSENILAGSVQTHRKSPMAFLSATLFIGVFLFVVAIVSDIPALTGSLFQITPGSAPATGIYVSQNYAAQPNERGSIVIQAGEAMNQFEGVELTFAVDPSLAELIRVKRTAVTQQSDISITFPVAGVVNIAIVGSSKNIAKDAHLLEVELKLARSSVLQTGRRIDLKLLQARTFLSGIGAIAATHNGRITVSSNQDALDLPFVPSISDVDPGAYALVSGAPLVIRGHALPTPPQVLLGSRSITVLSASDSEITVQVPEDTVPGVYTVSVESLLADEKVVVYGAPAAGGQIDILEEIMFADPNPVHYTPANPDANIVLWVPVFNPLGSSDDVIGSVDFSAVGGDPNVIFEGVGETAIGPGGETVNWFRVPESGTLSLAQDLETNKGYPITVRTENRSGSKDSAILMLRLQSQIAQGGMPVFGRIETVPAGLVPGQDIEFFVDVSDSDGVDSLQLVTLRLTELGGGIVEMSPAISVPSDGTVLTTTTYTANYSVPENLPDGNYQLELKAVDESANEAVQTFVLSKSSTVQQFQTPVITQAFSVPSQAPADDDTQVVFYIEVEDQDGIDDIEMARINLAPIGLGVEKLSLQSDISAKEGRRGIFESKKLKIPTTTASASYILLAEVEDSQGNFVSRSVPFMVGAALGGSAPRIIESRFVPETAAPNGDVRLYVEVEDLNGAEEDVLTVIADFTEVDLEIEELSDLINFPSGTLVTRTTYASKTITLPDHLSVGVYDIPLMAVDDTNNITRTVARLRVERGGAHEGQSPIIDEVGAFQVPRVLANDGKTEGELHVMIRDPDDDVLTVIANLGSVAKARSASVSDRDTDLDLMCKTSSSIVCMERGALESTGSRWFILKDINVPETTQQSTDPYMIEITAVDAAGHTVTGSIPLTVGGAEIEKELKKEPVFDLLVPVSASQIELVVSSPINFETVDRTGKQFIIKTALDASKTLAVRRVSWDTTGRYLYLQTDPMTAGETYILSVQSSFESGVPVLADVRGNRFAPDRGGKMSFTFNVPTGNPPVIKDVKVIDEEHIDVFFDEPVLPSSVHPDLLNSKASLISTVLDEDRSVNDGVLSDGGRVLRLEVDPLREGDRYRLQINGVLAPGLIESMEPVKKDFIAIFPRHGAAEDGVEIYPTADLNKDGRVDFADFTLFSSVYNTEYDRADLSDLETHGAALEVEEEESSYNYIRTKPKEPVVGGELPDIEF